MSQPVVNRALSRLRAAADRVALGWPTMRWTSPNGDSTPLDNLSDGTFAGLVLRPGVDLTLRCRVTLPARIAGVPLEGDPLELTIDSLYPATLTWNGRPVFEDDRPPVAAGPALVEVIPALREGDNGELVACVHLPNNQVTIPWFRLRFTTPGLRARFEALDVAWAQLALASELAATAGEQALVAEAAARLPEALPADDASALEAALLRLETDLSPLAPRAADLAVHLIGHSHVDMNWLWTWPDTVEVLRRDFRSVLALMDDYPELTFSHSQPATYEVIREREPAAFARVLDLIRQGRWEPATLTWVEGDVLMASGEAIARQLLEGVTYSRERLGASPTAFMAPDTFGFPGNLPQLAVSAGGLSFYHHRCNPGQADQWPVYWWEGQDGSRLLAMSTPSYNGTIRARDLAEAAIRARRFGLNVSLHFHGVGDHGGGPARQNLDALRRLRERSGLPDARCSTLERYARAVLSSGVALPLQRGESTPIFEGCYTTHADTKRFNRAGENLLGTAETLAALAGQDRADLLQSAWRSVLFHQFHDIFDGSAIHEVYAEQAVEFAAVEQAAGAVIDGALAVLESGLTPGRIAVTNPLGWEREDWVVAPGLAGQGVVGLVGDHGHRTVGQYVDGGLGFVARVPAFGTVGYAVEPLGTAEPALEAVPCFSPLGGRTSVLDVNAPEPPYLRIETPLFRAYVRRDSGILVSLYDKRVGRELVGFGMRRASDYLDSARADLALNVLQIVEEHPHGMSAWHLDEVCSETSLLRGATTRVVEAGPARLVLEVSRQVRRSTVLQKIVFYRDLGRIDFETDVDWQEVGGDEVGIPNLKVAFTAHLPESAAWFETPFAAARRPSDGQEVVALRWADVGGEEYGIALLNDSKYGYDALGNRLRLTLVRSAYNPDTHSDTGRHRIRYSLVPHPGNWADAGVVRMAGGFNQPLLAREVGKAPASAGDSRLARRPAVSGLSSVLVSCLKRSHDRRGLVLRLYESAGRGGEVVVRGLPAEARVWETSVVEDRRRELDSRDGAVTLAFRPWQVRTLLIEEGRG